MPTATQDSAINPFRWQRVAEYVIVAAIVIESAIFAVIAPQFLSLANLINVLLSIAIIGVLAVGMTFVILTGGIDLSVGSIAALAGIVAATVAQKSDLTGASVMLVSLAAAVSVGVIVGLFNGLMIARFRVPPFVVTLALLTIGRGLAFILTGGRAIGNLPRGFEIIGRSNLLGIPLPVWMMSIIFFVGWFVLKHTVIGRRIYATGGNREAAFLAGINTRRVVQFVYLFNGALVGLAGAMLASRLGAGVPSAGVQYELDVIASVVVGGTSLNGGRGSVLATLWGTIFIGVLNNGMNLAGVDSYVQKIALGVVILIAVLADQIGKGESR